MAIDPDVLNARLVTFEVRTGVYLNHNRRSCVVVKVSKDGKVHYLHETDSLVQLTVTLKDQFIREWGLFLMNYPAKRGIRAYNKHIREGFKYTAEAGAIIRAILQS
jgi:hypothetical protein